ncbi:zinc finger BED domain-containing protein 1-like isoform X1 [Gymnodraco acuticeps]|uniref:Zinc finger BED domain-containing protein 1-like isoform X1 n=2 Tax=Gymnodraco acuticeps TaxID=8218 RepID=A0A6P8VX09_GYMAC|nr:zinc finger BED domain-containing protein 1-like isoform X1 [Gymnodraco acuticeps]
MLERFLEQYPAIQAASLDQRLRKPMERDRLARFTDEDLRRAEDFIRLMRVMYTSTLCVSSENNPTSGQILPILKKLEMHFTVTDGDTVFVSNLKKQVWGNLSKRYQSDKIRSFLEEATALDPRFKQKMDDNAAVWDRIKGKFLAKNLTDSEKSTDLDCGGDGDENMEGMESEAEENKMHPCKTPKMTPLEELFADEDAQKVTPQQHSMSIQDQVEKELHMYKAMPRIVTSDDAAAWWWNMRTTYPCLSDMAFSYLCVQASSTPSERVFSTAGDTICAERSRILPEKADMLVFLNKNCF